MDISILKDWFGLMALIVSLLGTFYAWLTSQSSKNATAIQELTKRVDGHKDQIASMRTDISHLPSKQNVHELQLELAQITGTIGKVETSLEAMTRQLNMMDDYLREKASK